MDIQTIKKNLAKSPIPSIRTPFLPNGDIDFNGVRNMVDFLVEEAKVGTLLITNGDSLLTVMDDKEVEELTKVVIEQNKGRAMVIAGGKAWNTKKNVEFFNFAREAGADVGGLLLTDWAQSCGEAEILDAIREAGKAIPTMVLTNLISGRGIPLSVFKTVVAEKTPGFIGIKDDVCGQYGRDLATILDDKYAFMSGGMAVNHLDVAHYGADGYLSIFVSFYPQLSAKYWELYQNKEYEACAKWIAEVEQPFDKMIINNGLEFDSVIHGMMELAGVCGRYRRKPYHSLTDAEMEILKDYSKTLNL